MQSNGFLYLGTRRLLVFVFAVTLLGSCGTGVKERYTFIPDEKFEQAIIDLGLDDVIDGKVLTENISSIDSLNISYRKISDLSGIEAFTALTHLNCGKNRLTNLDVSQNTGLSLLYCYNNELTSLDLSKNTALIKLYCEYNQLTSLDISGCTGLTHFYCGNNQLTSLDISGCSGLTSFGCNENKLTSLDVSNCTALKWLICNTNQLTSLDLSKNTALIELSCSDNQFDCEALESKYYINDDDY